MQDQKIIQTYINNFRRHIAPYLKPGVGLLCKAYPSIQQGAILEFSFRSDVSNADQYSEPTDTINSALKKIPQRMFGGNLDGIRFGGTNISMEPNRIILIKGEDSSELWDDKGALNDVHKIVNVQMRGKK